MSILGAKQQSKLAHAVCLARPVWLRISAALHLLAIFTCIIPAGRYCCEPQCVCPKQAVLLGELRHNQLQASAARASLPLHLPRNDNLFHGKGA